MEFIEATESKRNSMFIIIKKWCKTSAARASFVLLLFSILLLFGAAPIIEVSWDEEIIDYVNNVLIGLAVGLIGIIITISFVQNALDKQASKNEKVEEYRKIIRYSKYLQILIREYTIYYNLVVTPVDKRGNEIDKGFISSFGLKDMNGMYSSSILLRDNYNTPVIRKFYEAEDDLFSYLLRWNEEIDFKYSKKIEEIINEFLAKSKQLDSRGNILGALETSLGNSRLSDIITKELTNNKEDYLAKYNEGKLSSNIMTPVVVFFLFLNVQQNCIKKLMLEIESIKHELDEICK